MKGSVDYLPDTNAVLRYLLQDDADQFPLAETFFKKVMEGRTRVIFLEGVLVECLYVLTKYYKVTQDEAARSLIGLLLYKGVVNRDKSVLIEGLQIFATSSLGPVDCFLIARSRIEGLQIINQ
jgi:predicted nucleic-acid-binding protein